MFGLYKKYLDRKKASEKRELDKYLALSPDEREFYRDRDIKLYLSSISYYITGIYICFFSALFVACSLIIYFLV